MQLDNNFYEIIIEFVQKEFLNTFQDDIVYKGKDVNIDHMGCFQIRYDYLPLLYKLVFENDRNRFVIDIYNKINAKTTLYRIVKFDSRLTKENITEAMILLKKVLEENSMSFYIYQNGKLYEEKSGKYTRIKDINKLR